MNQSVLLLIDVQQGMDDPYWGARNNPEAEQRITQLLVAWRARKWPVIHVQHHSTNPESPLRPNQPGCEFKLEAQPLSGETVFTKTVNSAFIGTKLEEYLRERGWHNLTIVGLTTDHCVSTTTRMAGNLGFDVQLVGDATATFERRGLDGELISASEMHRIHLASLHGEFCTVISADDLLAHLAD
ncbi:MAG: cysteine hydrolase family protein [Cyclobacteriaceae bacterium]